MPDRQITRMRKTVTSFSGKGEGRARNCRLAGRTALVTGAARRLGRAIAIALGRCGASVVVHCNRSRDEAAALVEELKASGVGAWTVQADLASPAGRRKVMSEALKMCGGFDILVNNASVFPEDRLAELDENAAWRIFRVNVFAPLDLSLAFAHQGRPGCIVNMLDSRITMNDARHASYHLGKRMLFNITRMLALDLAPRIRVNAVAPGLILPPAGRDERWMKRFAGRNPLRRRGFPEDVADAVLFLVSNPFVTGQVIYVDGGEHMKGAMHG